MDVVWRRAADQCHSDCLCTCDACSIICDIGNIADITHIDDITVRRARERSVACAAAASRAARA